MEECVDGEYQDFKTQERRLRPRALLRQVPGAEGAGRRHDATSEIWSLTRGGHDPQKVFAAYAAAVEHKGQPTVILAKTVKGYGMGEAGEGQMIAHQQKKMGEARLQGVPRPLQPAGHRRAAREVPFLKLAEDSPEMNYLRERRAALGG